MFWNIRVACTIVSLEFVVHWSIRHGVTVGVFWAEGKRGRPVSVPLSIAIAVEADLVRNGGR